MNPNDILASIVFGGDGGGERSCTAADVVAIVQLAMNNTPIPRHVITNESTYELNALWGISTCSTIRLRN